MQFVVIAQICPGLRVSRKPLRLIAYTCVYSERYTEKGGHVSHRLLPVSVGFAVSFVTSSYRAASVFVS